jgi:hypothetical protein
VRLGPHAGGCGKRGERGDPILNDVLAAPHGVEPNFLGAASEVLRAELLAARRWPCAPDELHGWRREAGRQVVGPAAWGTIHAPFDEKNLSRYTGSTSASFSSNVRFEWRPPSLCG